MYSDGLGDGSLPDWYQAIMWTHVNLSPLPKIQKIIWIAHQVIYISIFPILKTYLLKFHRVNTLLPEQNGWHLADNTLESNFLKEKFNILIQISLKFVPEGPTDNQPALIQVMPWCVTGNKP